MTIELKLLSKLKPHAKRIEDGGGNDFDFLPAVLLQVMEEQKRQATQLDENTKLLDTIKCSAHANDVQSKAQIKDTQTQIHNAQSALIENLAVMVRAQEKQATVTNEALTGIVLRIESFNNKTKWSLVVLKRLLIGGWVTSAMIVGLVIALLQRH